MIYTLTLNPSLDYHMEFDTAKIGTLNRATRTDIFPGGKGINVSQVLQTLDTPNTALGFVGGFTGEHLTSMLSVNHIQTKFTQVMEPTRINVKVKADTETELNAQGPAITQENQTDLVTKIQALSPDDMLILAGSIPKNMPGDIYQQLATTCYEKQIPFIADVEGNLLKDLTSYQPFLIKPNQHELGDLFGVQIETPEEAIPYAKQLVQMGAQHVIVSLAGDGAIFASKEQILTATIPNGIVKGSVGAGDSMVAGFVALWAKTKSLKKAFHYSVAAGSATAFSNGLCTKEKVLDLIDKIHITEI